MKWLVLPVSAAARCGVENDEDGGLSVVATNAKDEGSG
jgi:hypothetical protein